MQVKIFRSVIPDDKWIFCEIQNVLHTSLVTWECGPCGCEIVSFALFNRWDQTYAMRKSFLHMKPFRKPLIQDNWSVPLIISFTVICQARLIPMQQYCHTSHTPFLILDVFFSHLFNRVCVSIHFTFSLAWVCMSLHQNEPDKCGMIFKYGHTLFCNVERNISTFLLLNYLLKALMIYDNFLHLLWILI